MNIKLKMNNDAKVSEYVKIVLNQIDGRKVFVNLGFEWVHGGLAPSVHIFPGEGYSGAILFDRK
jgi:hypothetical protein